MQNEEFIVLSYLLIYHPAKSQGKIFIIFCVNFDQNLVVLNETNFLSKFT